MKILFICTGNICRSPAAEAVLRKMCESRTPPWNVDSAGISSWHEGELPDDRARAAAMARGYDMHGISSRAICNDDFTAFDRIYAMTQEHLDFMRANSPDDATADILLFLENADVPDPYFGGDSGFELMMDLLEKRCREIAVVNQTSD